MSEYKATGRQAEVPPDAPGIPFDEWLKKAPLCTAAQRANWMKARQEQEKRKEKPAKSSGALPGNSEWL